MPLFVGLFCEIPNNGKMIVIKNKSFFMINFRNKFVINDINCIDADFKIKHNGWGCDQFGSAKLGFIPR